MGDLNLNEFTKLMLPLSDFFRTKALTQTPKKDFNKFFEFKQLHIFALFFCKVLTLSLQSKDLRFQFLKKTLLYKEHKQDPSQNENEFNRLLFESSPLFEIKN